MLVQNKINKNPTKQTNSSNNKPLREVSLQRQAGEHQWPRQLWSKDQVTSWAGHRVGSVIRPHTSSFCEYKKKCKTEWFIEAWTEVPEGYHGQAVWGRVRFLKRRPCDAITLWRGSLTWKGGHKMLEILEPLDVHQEKFQEWNELAQEKGYVCYR